MIAIEETRDSMLLALLNKDVQNLHHQMQPRIFKPWDQQAIAADFKRMLRNSELRAFVAKSEDQFLGYILLKVTEKIENAFVYRDRFVYIDQISVKPESRGQGIGQLLMGKAFQVARKEGIEKIRLDHWTDNLAARDFFLKQGFSYFNEAMELHLK